MSTCVLLIGAARELVIMTGRILSRSGYRPKMAVGLGEARQILNRQTPNLIVMDCDLPDGDGVDACRELRKQNLPIKILLTSNDLSDELRALNAGADDFVKKPYNVEVLLARMKRLSETD